MDDFGGWNGFYPEKTIAILEEYLLEVNVIQRNASY